MRHRGQGRAEPAEGGRHSLGGDLSRGAAVAVVLSRAETREEDRQPRRGGQPADTGRDLALQRVREAVVARHRVGVRFPRIQNNHLPSAASALEGELGQPVAAAQLRDAVAAAERDVGFFGLEGATC